ncbi:uncharacterized protein LOC100373023 [Saccoglossus kowalevskii]
MATITSNVSFTSTPKPGQDTAFQGNVFGYYENIIIATSRDYFQLCACILFLCTFLSTIGNVIVIAVVYRKPSLQTITHLLIVNLAMADLLSSFLCVPFDTVSNFHRGSWVVGVVSCKVIRFLYFTFVSVSIITLSAIAIDRYYSVVYPLEKKITSLKGKLMIVFIWVHSVLICLPCLFVYDVVKIPGTERSVCVDVWNARFQQKIYLGLWISFTVFIPLAITCLAYCFVWRAFRLSQRRVFTTSKTIHFRVDMSTVSPTDHRVVTLHLQRRDNAPPIPDNGDIFVVSKNGIENKNINGLKKISVAEVHREDVRTNVPCSSSPGIPPPAGNEEASSGTNQDSLELKSNWMKGYGTRKRLLPPLGSTPETLVETNKKKRKGKKKRMKRRKSLETPEAHDELRTLKGVGNVTASVGSL